MKILQVTPFLGEQYGGCERYCYNLSKELVKLGHDVEIFTARINQETPLIGEIDGVRFRRFYTPKVIWNINPLTIMLHRLLNTDHDVIHVHSYLYFSSNQAILAKILRSFIRRRTRLVLHLHGGIGNPLYLNYSPLKKIGKRVYDALIGNLMIRAADCILSADETNAKAATKYFHIPLNKIQVIHNGVDLSEFINPRKKLDNEEILFVGDLEWWKGAETLIKAMHHLNTNGDKVKLKIVGKGSLRTKLEAQSDGLDIEFLGQIPHSQIPKLMRNALAVVLPSLWEGVPTVGLEAMAAGTPFIGTNIGGIPEIVHHNETGLLVPPSHPIELANAILRLRDAKFRQKLANNAFKMVKNRFEIALIAKQTEKLYKLILSR